MKVIQKIVINEKYILQFDGIDTIADIFSDELLSRIDEIINFKNLTKMDLKKIIRKNCPHEVKEEDIELILKEYDMKLQGRGIVKAANKYFQNKAKAQS